ncbi:MAG: metallophosphoesterase [Eubacteriales bacterium]|nr:metallophosphoesterase [Eubacteriales bacterium]
MSHETEPTLKPNSSQSKPTRKQPLQRFCVFFASFATLLALLNWGTKARFVTRYYEVFDERIHDDVRIAILSDLHGALYGKNQTDLVAALEQAAPDVVLLLGDIYDQDGIDSHAVELVDSLSGRFSCFFIPGNHEYKSGDFSTIRDLLCEADIPILAGNSTIVTINETQVQLFGVDDGQGGKSKQLWQIANAGSQRKDDIFSILAIHVPNDVESHLHYGFDLMLSGHTHGGQIIIPHVINGLYAPGQGFFPKYGGGRYDFGKQTLIISRGLSQKPLWLPRLGNPPELTIVTLKPVS